MSTTLSSHFRSKEKPQQNSTEISPRYDGNATEEEEDRPAETNACQICESKRACVACVPSRVLSTNLVIYRRVFDFSRVLLYQEWRRLQIASFE